MKVYITKARELREKYSNFTDWKGAMVKEYGSDIVYKIDEIWKILLDDKKNVLNSNDLNRVKVNANQIKKANIGSLKSYNRPLDPESFKLISEMIGLYAEKGIVKFNDVMQESVKDLGDWVKPYVKKAWDEIELRKTKPKGIKQEAINQNGNDKVIDQLPEKSIKESAI